MRHPYTDVSPLMGGLYPFYRRLYFIGGVLVAGFGTSALGAPDWLAIICCGLSLGPLLMLEQWWARRTLARLDTESGTS